MICLTCGRVRPAAHRSEYTPERGHLVAERGLCVCITPPRRPPGRKPARHRAEPLTAAEARPATEPARG